MRFNCELSKALSDLAISDALLGVDAAFSQFYNILMTLVDKWARSSEDCLQSSG